MSFTSSGTLAELIAQGAGDMYLTSCPTITYFRFKYNKHTNFAMESIEQPFQNQVAFGSEVQVTLNRTGDLIYFMYVVVDLPGICACQATIGGCGISGINYPHCPPCKSCDDGSDPEGGACGVSSAPDDDFDACVAETGIWAHYVNAVGQYLIKRAAIVIGGQVIDTLYSDYLFMWEELSGKSGKMLEEMIGKRYTPDQLIKESRNDRRLYIPLPFWFTQISGNALPMVSLQFHGVQVHVVFEELRKLIQVSDAGVSVIKTKDGSPLNGSDLKARIDSTYIYLDMEERDRFATGCFEQLITQVQALYFSTKTSQQIRVPLNFNHPIIELIWAARRQCNEDCNQWSNYAGYRGKDPIKHVELKLNNLPRFSREGRYFRLVQPYQFHSHIPQCYVYCYSFALHPEEPNPSGSCNFSRIDNVEMLFTLQDELAQNNDNISVIIFARAWNVMRYREGLGGLAFAG